MYRTSKFHHQIPCFVHERFMQTEASSIDRLQDLLPQLFNSTVVEGEPFLRVQLTPETTVGFPLKLVEEVQLMSVANITPMPNMSEEILGLVQAKGHIFWLLDLARLLGFPALINRSKRYEMVMIRAQHMSFGLETSIPAPMEQELFLGFAVQKVRGSMRLSSQEILPLAEDTDSSLRQHLQGRVVKNGESISLLKI